MKKLDTVIEESLALAELKEFVSDILFKEEEDEKIKTTYPQVLQAIMAGKLSLNLNEGEPTYDLIEPIKNASGVDEYTKITFKTRLSVSEKTKLAKGVDMKGDPMSYPYKVMAHCMRLPVVALLDKMGRFDLRVCEQLCTLFQ